MAKATLKERIRSIRQKPDAAPVRRFLDAPARETAPAERTVQPGSVDIEARTLSAVVATNASRLLEIWDDDLCRDVIVEEIVLVEGMDLSRVDTGMQFLDNHNVWELEANLGRVTAARLEEVDGSGPSIVVDIQMSSRPDLDWMITDLANDVLGCISCQYRPIESTLEQRDGQYPLLTHTKSELLEVSLVSVPADPHASVRSETSLKGQNMAGKPNPTGGAREAVKRGFAARAAKRAEEAAGATAALDDAAIADIVDAVIEEVVPAVVDEIAAAAGDDAGADMTGEDKAKAEADAKAAEEAKTKADAGAGTDIRSMIRSAVQAKLGNRSATPAKNVPQQPDLTALRSVAAKYGVGAEFDDMAKLGSSETELRSFVLNATASRSGTGQTHDGRNASRSDQGLSFSNSFRGKRAAERATRR